MAPPLLSTCHSHGLSLATRALMQKNTAIGSAVWQIRFAHTKPKLRAGEKSPLLNPPASTRPPLLATPERSQSSSAASYYFNLGKAYLKFYKDGLKAVFHNRKLLKEKLDRTPIDDRPSIYKPHFVPKSFSRADWVLFWRVKHDMLRLPFFGLMLLVIGEFTALVVLWVDGVVPYTCRIPKQIGNNLQQAEERRRLVFRELEAKHPQGVLSPSVNAAVARKHVLRSLHIAGNMWDKLGFIPPGMWGIKGNLRMAFLEGDDRNIVEDGGIMGLEADELRIACAERGIDTLGRSDNDLRRWLGDWLRLTAAEDIQERRRRMATLLLTSRELAADSKLRIAGLASVAMPLTAEPSGGLAAMVTGSAEPAQLAPTHSVLGNGRRW